jgi:hypothetical protein
MKNKESYFFSFSEPKSASSLAAIGGKISLSSILQISGLIRILRPAAQ